MSIFGTQKISPCRLCGDSRSMQLLYGFGLQPVAGYLESDEVSARGAPKYELATAICKTCSLVQQAYDNGRDILASRVYSHYQPTYSMSKQVTDYMDLFLRRAIKAAGTRPDDYALEIGSNDGQTLLMLKKHGLHPIGFEPASNLALATREQNLDVIEDYFGSQSAQSYLKKYPPVKLVVTRHTLEHAFDPLDFLLGIQEVLAADGLAVIEIPYFYLQMMNNQFQSLSFQHVSFFTAAAMSHALNRTGLELIDLAFVNMDGGSMVVYVRKATKAIAQTAKQVDIALCVENALELDRPSGYETFFKRIDFVRTAIGECLIQSHRRGMQIGAYGAGGKGQALLNMLNLDVDTVSFVLDDVPGNIGHFVPGTGIPVISSTDPRAQDLDIVVVTAPTHVQEIVRKASARLASGTRFLATAPDFHCVITELSR